MSQNRQIKQVIVVRHDLKMRLGKAIAQGSHASIAFIMRSWRHGIRPTKEQIQWMDEGQTKICVRCDSEEELLDIQLKARQAGLEVHLIVDAGHTEFHGVSTKTCLAIGPNLSEKIDLITGSLKLL